MSPKRKPAKKAKAPSVEKRVTALERRVGALVKVERAQFKFLICAVETLQKRVTELEKRDARTFAAASALAARLRDAGNEFVATIYGKFATTTMWKHPSGGKLEVTEAD